MWILPTRSRVGNFKRAMERYPDADVVVVFTEGDPDLPEMLEEALPPAWGSFLALPESTVPSLLNQVFAEYPEEPVYGFIGDDVIPPYGEWWRELAEAAFPRYFSFPKDSLHGGSNAPHFAIGGDLVRAAGWLAPPWYHHNWIDTTWYAIAQDLRVRRYLPDLLFEHQHPIRGFKDDPIYQLGRSRYKEDEEKFKFWSSGELRKGLVRQIQGKLNVV